ncbi:invasion associated locus B family protein [Fluviibacterium sp. S390]|uniref:invasion associated locus B family protein n=1 Tax=Fluviibacterium sp. S390 TaxID=3415139 RepID=UPI003C79A2E4
MRNFLIAGALSTLIAALPATAQQTAPNAAPNAAQATAAALPQSRADAQPNQTYEIATHGDWSLRCIRLEQVAFDPCEIQQTLLNPEGNPTADFSLFPVDNPELTAGATVITPLETLLTRRVSFSADGGEAVTYPFQFCNRQGCIAQLGLNEAEIARMRSGSNGEIAIYPMVAPDNRISLTVSLSGFTAAYNELMALPRPQ